MSTTVSTVTSTNAATARGTKIQQASDTMDRNAFLKILTAEMSNQDPENPQDSTQYVAQLAQFSSLEQMANLNATMTLSSAASLIDKTVNLKYLDSNGKPYTGVVKSVSKSGDNVTLNVDITENGKTVTEEFNFSDITNIN